MYWYDYKFYFIKFLHDLCEKYYIVKPINYLYLEGERLDYYEGWNSFTCVPSLHFCGNDLLQWGQGWRILRWHLLRCVFMFALVQNFWGHRGQSTSFSFWWTIFLWIFRARLVVTALSHSSHLKGLGLALWLRLCTVKAPFRPYCFPHWSQRKGFSFVWVTRWVW